MSKAQAYDLTEQAIEDLEDIYDYTCLQFDAAQAAKYLTELKASMVALSINSLMGVERNEIRSGLRSFPKNEHVIFYRLVKKRLRVVRVLHSRRDVSSMKFIG